ncbi:MAG: ribosomal-protein-alanine N-acetyltransferase [Cyanobacteria bacterium SIG29]|nr:ribosomal-protein-alanine N-acetyltransferase [Cyanobacteria bacterium SIG29]
MQKVQVLKMLKDDVDAVFEIEKLVHPNHHWSKDSFYNELANNLAYYYCIKNEDGIILAYIGLWQILEEAHITTLAVHPDYRNMQLAQIILIKAIEDCYKNMIKYITLEVRESNIPAISLYEKFLFESIGMRKNYYQDNGENAIIMFTQNIWYDKFKDNFNSLKENINKVNVCYDE